MNTIRTGESDFPGLYLAGSYSMLQPYAGSIGDIRQNQAGDEALRG